jgi:hypothetical protein
MTVHGTRLPQALPVPRLRDIPEPSVIGLFVGNGTGSKLLQSYLDGAPELYMIPAYPMMYFYPHWRDWSRQHAGQWDWRRALELFCEKHASVLDSRRIPGFNGLQNLGRGQDEHLEIDETTFRQTMLALLEGESVTSRSFVLAVHYAYHLCRGEDIGGKHVLIYHVHAPQYLEAFLADFPAARVIAMTRDPRTNFDRRVQTSYNVDEGKLSKSDTYLFRALPNYHVLRQILEDLQFLGRHVPPERFCVIRHEDLGLRLEAVLQRLCAWARVSYRPEMHRVTFGGKEWWGDKVYDMEPTNAFNRRVLSKSWAKKGFAEIFVWEGLMLDFFRRYGYACARYTADSWWNRLRLVCLALVPMQSERDVVRRMCSPRAVREFLDACLRESRGELPLKTRDYTWNGTHRYKFMYIELQLWRIRPHVRWLEAARSRGTAPRVARTLYVAGQCVRYGYALAALPYWYLRLRKAQIARLLERLRGRAALHEPLVRAWE